MTPEYIARRAQEELNRLGSTITLRRRVGLTDVFTDATVKATRKEYQPTENVRMSEVPGDMESGDLIFTVSSRDLEDLSWPVPPKDGDLIVTKSRTWAVIGAGLKEVSDVSCAWLIYARGG